MPQMESSSPSNLSNEYAKKENYMTTSARGAVREQATEEQGGEEQEIYPLLLATLMGRREERREEINPLLMAVLMGRREERRDDVNPLLMAVLMGRREGGEERWGLMAPLLIAAMAARGAAAHAEPNKRRTSGI